MDKIKKAEEEIKEAQDAVLDAAESSSEDEKKLLKKLHFL